MEENQNCFEPKCTQVQRSTSNGTQFKWLLNMQTINNTISMNQSGQDHEEDEEHNEETQRLNAGILKTNEKTNEDSKKN